MAQWGERDLSEKSFKYIFVDGVTFPLRIDGTIERIPVLVARGVTESGHRMVLGLQAGNKESASSWREFFKDLKRRGLDGANATLGIMDGLPGLERVFREESPKAKVQRCEVHVTLNVLVKVPRKLKKLFADDLQSMFYASLKKKGTEFYDQFKTR